MVFKTFDEQNRLIIETLPKQFTNICKDTIFFSYYLHSCIKRNGNKILSKVGQKTDDQYIYHM